MRARPVPWRSVGSIIASTWQTSTQMTPPIKRLFQFMQYVRQLVNSSSRAVRLAAVGSVIGAAITYPIFIAAKTVELLPPHFTWLKIAVAPGALWGMLLLPLAMQGLKEREK